eukprot:969814-Pleurochrysis_carterae.AAC.1
MRRQDACAREARWPRVQHKGGVRMAVARASAHCRAWKRVANSPPAPLREAPTDRAAGVKRPAKARA